MSRLNASKRRKSVRSFGKSNHSARLLLASAVSSALWATHQALGQSIPSATLYWDVNGTTSGSGGPTPTGAWGTAVNWNTDPTGGAGGSFTGATLTSDSLIFAAGTDATSPYTVTVSGTQAAGNISFMSPGSVTLTGGAISLASGGNISNTSGGLATFNTTINTTSGTGFNITGNSSATFNLINNNGGGGLLTATVNTTAGITTFGGTADNSSAAIVVNSGTVYLSKASNSGTHAADGLTINGGVVQIDGNATAGTIDQQVYEGSFINIGSGTLDLNGRNEGVPSLSGGSTATITNTASSLATLTLGENNNDGNTYNGQIIDGTGGVAVTHIGTGTSILDGANTFTGGLAIQSGTIQFGTFASLGNGNITLGSAGGNATLNANGSQGSGTSGGFNNNVSNPIFSTGNGTNTIEATSWNPTFSGAITLNNNLQIVSDNAFGSNILVTGGVTGIGNLTLQSNANTFDPAQITFSTGAINIVGSITNSGTGSGNGNPANVMTTISANIGSNVTGVIQNSAGSALTLSGNNTYSSPTTISAGTLQLGSANAVQDSTIAVSGGSLAFSTGIGSFTAGGLSGTGNIVLADTGSGAVSLLVGNNNGNTTYSGVLSGAGGVTKVGTGLWTLAGANSFSGLTAINAGGVVLTGNLSNSNVTVGTGSAAAFLSVTGTGTANHGSISASVTVNAGAAIDFSKDGATITPQTLSVGNLILTTGAGDATTTSSLTFNLNNGTPGSPGTDTISAGTLNVLSGGQAIINVGGIGVTGDYVLMSYGSQSGQTAPGTVGTGATFGVGGALGAGAVIDSGPFVLGTQPSGLNTLQLDDTSTELLLQITANPTPATAYWYGGESGVNGGTWGANNGNASSPVTNWSVDVGGTVDTGQIPGPATDVVFSAVNGNGANISTVLETNYTINSLTVNSTPASVTIGGSGANLIINAAASTGNLSYPAGTGINILSGAGPLTINTTGQVVAAANQTWTNGSSNTFTVSSGVEGTAASGNITTLTLSNTSTGNTTLSGTITDSTSTGQFALVVNNTGSGITTLLGSNTYSGSTTSAGTLQLGNAAAAQNSGIAMSGGSLAFSTGIGTFTISGLSGSGNVALADTGSTAVTLQFNGSGTSTYSGAMSGNGGVTMIGTGEQIFSGNNTYSGGTTVNAGTLQLSGSGILGDASGALTVNGGTVDLNATSQSIGVLTGTGGTILDSNISPSTLTIGTGDASGTFAGVIANGNGNVTLAKVGTGTTTLTGSNSFSQLTVISGNVNLNGMGAVGAGDAIVINGGGVTANSTRAIGAGTAITVNAGQLTIAAVTNDPPTNWGNITLNAANGGSATLLINSPVPGGADPTITDQIFSTGNGTNEIMATNWNPTFTGPISLSNDLLIVSNNSGGSDITVTGGITGTGNLTLQSNAGTGQPSQIRINTGPVTTSGTITNSGTGSGGNNVTTTISANIGNSTGVIQNSAGSALILSGSNTYPGPTTVSAGTLFLQTSGSNNISHSSAITVASGATLDVTGVSGFTLSNTAGAGGNASQVLGGSGTVNGALTVGPGSTISAGTSVALGTGSSTSIGILTSGAQTWNGNGTYSWKISGNATGTPGVAPGSGDSGTMGISGNLGAGVEGTNWDLLKIGGLNLSSLSPASPFTIAPVAAITSGNNVYSWIIAQSAGNSSISGVPLATNLTTNGGSGLFVLDTSGFTDTNNPGLTFASFTLEAENINGNEDLVLDYSAAPEPGTILLVVGGFVPMLMGRRRRQRRQVSPAGLLCV